MNKKIILASCLFTFMAFGAPPMAFGAPPSQRAEVPKSPSDPQAMGVIIKFHKWPSKEERKTVQKSLSRYHLEQKNIIESLNLFSYDWPKEKSAHIARKICFNLRFDLQVLTLIQRCEANAIPYPE